MYLCKRILNNSFLPDCHKAGRSISGLTGFDSKVDGFVSMPGVADRPVKTFAKQQLAITTSLLLPNRIK